MNTNIFWHFLYVYYMVVFRSNSLCKMGDNELYSRIFPIANECQRFLALLKGSYLVVFKNNCLCYMGDNELYSKFTTLQMNAKLFWNFL